MKKVNTYFMRVVMYWNDGSGGYSFRRSIIEDNEPFDTVKEVFDFMYNDIVEKMQESEMYSDKVTFDVTAFNKV